MAKSSRQSDIELRRQVIVEILKIEPKYQTDVKEEVNSRLNREYSQPTISRDLKALNLPRHKGKYSLPSHYMKEQAKKELSELLVKFQEKSYDNNISFFALKTKLGTSHLLANRIKQIFSDEIIGSIADDEFCLFIAKDSGSAKSVLDWVNNATET